MRIARRTLIVLAAALLVVGALLGLRQMGMLADLANRGPGFESGRERFEERETRPDPGFFAPEGSEFRERGRHGEHGASLFGLVEVGKNLAIIGVIVALGVLATRLYGALTRRQKAVRVGMGPPA